MKNSLRFDITVNVSHRCSAATGPEPTASNKQTDGDTIRRSIKGGEQAGKKLKVQSIPLSFLSS